MNQLKLNETTTSKYFAIQYLTWTQLVSGVPTLAEATASLEKFKKAYGVNREYIIVRRSVVSDESTHDCTAVEIIHSETKETPLVKVDLSRESFGLYMKDWVTEFGNYSEDEQKKAFHVAEHRVNNQFRCPIQRVFAYRVVAVERTITCKREIVAKGGFVGEKEEKGCCLEFSTSAGGGD